MSHINKNIPKKMEEYMGAIRIEAHFYIFQFLGRVDKMSRR